MELNLPDMPTLTDQAFQKADSLRHMREAERNADAVRERCQSLAGFVKEAWHVLEPGVLYVHGRHIEVVCEHLEACWRGEILELIINIPPGFAKSLLVSVFFPMWVWGPMGQPHKKFVGLSSEATLATRDNNKCRRLVKSEWYQYLWGDVVQIAPDQDAKTDFGNTQSGFRQIATTDNVTGKRGDGVLMDDMLSVPNANSELERDKVNLWVQEALPTRINDPVTSFKILIMQRIHMNDPTGYILSQDWGWDHLFLPMRYEKARVCETTLGRPDWRTEEGELLFPERFPEAEVQKLEDRLLDYGTAGQLQQRPAPREGGMFKVGNIDIIDHAPAECRWVRGWDIAGTTRKNSPYTAGVLIGEAPNGDVIIGHAVRARKKIGEAERLICTTAFQDQDQLGINCLQSIPQDPGQSALSQKRQLSRKLRGTNYRFSPESGKKQDRAIPLASEVEAGNVSMVKGDWNHDLIEEMRNFPSGTYMDQVDAASRAFSELIRRGRPRYGLAGPQVRQNQD